MLVEIPRALISRARLVENQELMEGWTASNV